MAVNTTVSPNGTCGLCGETKGLHAEGCELASLRQQLEVAKRSERHSYQSRHFQCFCVDCESEDPLKWHIRVRDTEAEIGSARTSFIWSVAVGATIIGLASVLFPSGEAIRENPIMVLTILLIGVGPVSYRFSALGDAQSRAKRARERYLATLKFADEASHRGAFKCPECGLQVHLLRADER